MKVEILKKYKSNKIGSIIYLDSKEARILIKKNIVRQINNDFLLKPTSIIKNFVSRAFSKSPKIK